ncbi:hypothetical protein A9Z63_01850 [Moraxella lacunata]|uniref:Uncharacterized protein n=1 Tax=Moraxella lacunata TaxID=477 RepID=A0A1B8Q3G5_MORLA|nr:hypothetical protein A9Z63_01850 [Moraxella lacunata]OBX63699.1 hypothetical protein A9309_05675 [Moraxella lacunata]
MLSTPFDDSTVQSVHSTPLHPSIIAFVAILKFIECNTKRALPNVILCKSMVEQTSAFAWLNNLFATPALIDHHTKWFYFWVFYATLMRHFNPTNPV